MKAALPNGVHRAAGHNAPSVLQAGHSMSHPWQTKRHILGTLLVLAQFGLLLWLGLMAAPQLLQGRMTPLCWVLLLLSGGLGGWTLLHNRLGNFNVHPEPKANAQLVTTGPYRWIRHPMYSTVLLLAAALACVAGSLLAWLVWLALFGVLLTKAVMEERWLREYHPDYARYIQHSKRFIPWLV
jgi:protein-S-isoprenylcysteine O-methyltransferase Ste14